MPWIPRPGAGESYVSWINRSSAELAVPPALIAHRLGAAVHPATGRLVAPGIDMDGDALAGAEAGTGLEQRVFADMQLSRYSNAGLLGSGPLSGSALRQSARADWVELYGSRLCPTCLAFNGGIWSLHWKLAISGICAIHRLLLTDRCPAGHRLRYRDRHLSRTRIATPSRCQVPVDGRVCGAPLNITQEPVHVPGWMAQTQWRIVQGLEQGHAWIAGQLISSRELHQLIQTISGLSQATASIWLVPAPLPAEIDGALARIATGPGYRGGSDGYRSPPRTAIATAAVLALLTPIVAAEDDCQLADAARPLQAALEDYTPRGGYNPLATLPIPPVLRRHLQRRQPSSPRQRARDVVALHGLMPGTIPELIPVEMYRASLGRLVPDTHTGHARRYAALAVAIANGATTWADAAAATRCDPTLASYLAREQPRSIHDSPGYWAGIADIARDLHALTLDYAHRRRVLGALTELAPPPAGTALARELVWTHARRCHAAAWLWAELAGGHPNDSPAHRRGDWDATPEHRRVGYRRFVTALTPTAADALRAHGLLLCGEIDPPGRTA